MRPIIQRLMPAPRAGGFRLRDHWVWCGSPIRDNRGRYHLFASVWPKELSFAPHWLTNSRIVRAEASSPAGPYHLRDEVLGPRGTDAWDGRMAHNPTVHRVGGEYLLFYTGSTYTGPTPDARHPLSVGHPRALEARANQRIGVAVAPEPAGPWQRLDHPILEPRDGCWDNLLTANPAVCLNDRDELMLYYKSASGPEGNLKYGLAKAATWDASFKRMSDGPILDFDDSGAHIEDAYVWRQDGQYRMIFKDMTDRLTGERHAGVEAWSADGLNWSPSDLRKAYSRKVRWDDGSTTTQGCLERPQLLIENDRATHLYFATADGPGGFHYLRNAWNLVVPLVP